MVRRLRVQVTLWVLTRPCEVRYLVLSVECADPDLGFGARATVFLAMNALRAMRTFSDARRACSAFAPDAQYAEADIVPVCMGRATTAWIDL